MKLEVMVDKLIIKNPGIWEELRKFLYFTKVPQWITFHTRGIRKLLYKVPSVVLDSMLGVIELAITALKY